MVSSFINLGWGRGTQMALCFKMILINQLHNHNQNALDSPPPLPWITAEQRGCSVRLAREWQVLKTKPDCGERARGRVRGSVQTCVPLRARVTTAGCGSHHKHLLHQCASEQMTGAGEGTSMGGFVDCNGQGKGGHIPAGAWTISKQECAHTCRKKV